MTVWIFRAGILVLGAAEGRVRNQGLPLLSGGVGALELRTDVVFMNNNFWK